MKIVLWKTPGCPRCKGVEQQLKIKGIEFDSNEDANSLSSKGFSSAPILQVDDKYLIGKEIFDWIKTYEI